MGSYQFDPSVGDRRGGGEGGHEEKRGILGGGVRVASWSGDGERGGWEGGLEMGN